MAEEHPIVYGRVAAIPVVVRAFCFSNEGWVVGGAAKYLLGLTTEPPRDWDILVPLWQWGVACRSIPEGSPTNSHGGVKLTMDGVEIDVWGGDIGWFLGQVPSYPAYAVHPKTMTWLMAGNGVTRSR